MDTRGPDRDGKEDYRRGIAKCSRVHYGREIIFCALLLFHNANVHSTHLVLAKAIIYLGKREKEKTMITMATYYKVVCCAD